MYGAEGQILLARSRAGRTIVPAPLPEAVRAGLDSPHPAIRLGAVAALGEWLTDPDPGRALTARRTLQHVVDTDIPRVATSARNLLGAGAPPPAPTPPRPTMPRYPGPAGGTGHTTGAGPAVHGQPPPRTATPPPRTATPPRAQPPRDRPRGWPAYRVLAAIAIVGSLCLALSVGLTVAGEYALVVSILRSSGLALAMVLLPVAVLLTRTGGRFRQWALGAWIAASPERYLMAAAAPNRTAVFWFVAVLGAAAGLVAGIGCAAGAWLRGWRRYLPLALAVTSAVALVVGAISVPSSVGFYLVAAGEVLTAVAALVLAVSLVTLPVTRRPAQGT